MQRIFLTLVLVSQGLLIATVVVGYDIRDARLIENRPAVSNHLLTALGALVFALLVHAILLTYFMGTGRWMEETSRAYRLSPDYCRESSRLKYTTLPWMILCVVLLIVAGALGAAADPRGGTTPPELWGLPRKTLHFVFACGTLLVNLWINVREYQAIQRNGLLVKRALGEVQRIRQEHGLPV